MKIKLLAFAAFAAVAVASCKKDDDTTSNGASRSTLIQGSWKASFEAEDDNNNKVLDANERQPASIASTATFNSGGGGTISYNNTPIPLTWLLINNDQQLVTTIPGLGSDTVYIHTLTTTELITEDRSASTYSWIGATK